MMIYFELPHLLVGLGLLVLLLPVLWLRTRSFSFLFFLILFWLYLLAVVSAVVYPIGVSLVETPNFRPNINLIPFSFGDCSMPVLCVRGIIGNLLLTVPFGFGMNFLVHLRPVKAIWLALAVGFGFELTQLLVSVVYQSRSRVIDINDALLNVAGVLVGYLAFRLLARLYLALIKGFRLRPKGVFAYLYQMTSYDQAGDSTTSGEAVV